MSNPGSELEALESLVESEGWKYCLILFSSHQQRLMGRVLASLRNYEDRLAGEYSAKFDEVKCIIDLVKGRIQELKEKEK